jgi:hypothetical protein
VIRKWEMSDREDEIDKFQFFLLKGCSVVSSIPPENVHCQPSFEKKKGPANYTLFVADDEVIRQFQSSS